jgi:hypothetical protein
MPIERPDFGIASALLKKLAAMLAAGAFFFPNAVFSKI